MIMKPIQTLLVVATVICCSSCGRGTAPVSSAPSLDEGKYYTITFPKDSAFTQQTAFKVVDASRGSWIKVEVYKNPMELFCLQLAVGMAAEGNAKPQAERERMKRDALAEIKKTVELKWINLNQATSVFETPDEMLGMLKEL
jgi:hypothetical protein